MPLNKETKPNDSGDHLLTAGTTNNRIHNSFKNLERLKY